MTAAANVAARTAVEVRDLAFSYGGPIVLDGIDFAIPPGTTAAVLGPNGSGKSTLLRAVMGELKPLSGSAAVHGRYAYVPQNERARLDFPVNAHDVALMGRYRSLPWWRRISKNEKAKATCALERVKMADLAGAHYGSLSGGQRQRVLIARALAQNADVLLLDEPYAHVDPTSAALIDDLLTELRAEGRTALITTHDVEQARAWDLVLCLNRRQIAFGEPGQTLTPPILQATYGKELIVLSGAAEGRAIAIQHHRHD